MRGLSAKQTETHLSFSQVRYLLLFPEGDVPGVCVHSIHNCQGFQVVTHIADGPATVLEALFNYDTIPSTLAPADFAIAISPCNAQPFAKKSSIIKIWSSESKNCFETITLFLFL